MLRFHFSFFLLPVYLFALSQVPVIDPWSAVAIFIILHLLIYPSSNGYNSYMDRDTGSIGGVEQPSMPTQQLFCTSVVMDIIAIAASLFIDVWFACCVVAYILASRAYSYRGIRLKKHPVIGYLTVVIFQGAVTFFMVYHGSSADRTFNVPVAGMVASSLLIGGFYPLTQIYQHEADLKDGVKTISYIFGIRGTFFLTVTVYSVAMVVLAIYFTKRNETKKFLVIATAMLPIVVYFFRWLSEVWKDETRADFRHTMRMNLVASLCTNTAFLILLTWRFL